MDLCFLCTEDSNQTELQSGKSGTQTESGKMRESNQASGVHKAHYTTYYVRKISILLPGTGVRKISSVACGFRPIKIHFTITQKVLSAK